LANSFLPFPQFPAQNLVSPVEVKPATGIPSLIPSGGGRDRSQDRKDAKDIVNMLLAGGLSGTASSGLVSLLDHLLPGLKLKQEIPELEEEEEYPPKGLDAVDTSQLMRARKLSEEILGPQVRPTGKQTTGRGQLLENILAAAPAYAAKTPAGAKAFGDMRSSVSTAESVLRKAKMDAQEDREKERWKIEGDILGEDREAVVFNGSVPVGTKLKPYSRRGVQIGDQDWILSQGDPDVDKKIDGELVADGAWYRNTKLTLRPGDLKEVTYKNMFNTTSKGPRRAFRRVTEFIDAQGRKRQKMELQLPDKNGILGWVLLEDAPGFWIEEPPQGTYKPTDYPDEVVATATDMWKGMSESQGIIGNAALAATHILIMADPDSDSYSKDAFTDASLMARAFAFVSDNVDAMRGMFGDSNALRNHYAKTFDRRDAEGNHIGRKSLAVSSALENYTKAVRDNASDNNIQSKKDILFERVEQLINSPDAKDLPAADTIRGLLPKKVGGIRKVSRARARLLASQLQLAYMAAAAAGQTGKTLSDRDVVNFLAQVGFGDNDVGVVRELVTQFVYDRFLEFETTANTQVLAFIDDAETGEADRRYLRTVLDLTEEELTNPELGLDRISKATDGWASHFWKWDDKANRLRYKPWAERAASDALDFTNSYLGKDGYFNRFLKVEFGKPRSPDPTTEEEDKKPLREGVDDFINVRFGSER